MDYLIFALTIVVLLALLFFREAYLAKKKERQFEASLYTEYGKRPAREISAERMVKARSYYERHIAEGCVDDITWADLGLDEIFRQMNHTFSATGEEYLYYTLRKTTESKEELECKEEIIRFFEEHPKERVKVQLLMNDLGFTGKYSLYDYIGQLDTLGERNNRRILLQNLLFLPLIGLMFFRLSIAIFGIALLMIHHFIVYFREKKIIEPYIVSFAYIMRLMKVAEAFEQLPLPACRVQQEAIRAHEDALRNIRRGSFWVMWQTTGSPLDVIVDYIRMIFHTDIYVFNKMLARVRRHVEDIDVIIGQLGYVETAIAIGELRASMSNGYCVPQFEIEGELILEEAYHPLLKVPVKNSITTGRGVLLTGSNASGKSTFLRTVALNVILAQTIHTCPAKVYRAPLYRIYSSMSLQDDLGSGESYYIVEIKALKRILDAAHAYEGKVICFVDEVLRGTNTVERIAATTQILKSLAGTNLTCFAATHDIELTKLLEGHYDNYHFEEDVREGDIFFDYYLKPGPATTRNAIRLLEIMGYDGAIVEEASAMAERFVADGRWQ